MFEAEQQKLQGHRINRKILNVVFVAIKLATAYALITYTDYGIFIVVGYLLYAIENINGIQFINSQEVNLQLNILHQRISELESNEKQKKL